MRKVLIRFWPTSFVIYELDRARGWLLDRRNRPQEPTVSAELCKPTLAPRTTEA